MLAFLFKVGGSLFLAVLVAWIAYKLGLDSVVLYANEGVVLTFGFAAAVCTFFAAFLTFAVKA